VVKLAETQTNFFTLAQLLRRQGYRTEFVYGGHAHFDNMSRFFLNNGFDRIIDQPDFEDPVWVGHWGVADEELLRFAHEELVNTGEQPLFQLVFTTTHHSPFDIPPDRVEAVRPGESKHDLAVRYVDHTFARFIEQARDSDYWDHTLIYMTADHNSRVYGDHLVPIHRYHIPGLVLGGPVEARKVPGITSQIDMLPTLLSLLGVDSRHPAIGRDLTRAPWRDGAGRAMMQFNGLQAYIEEERTVVLLPDQEPRFFEFDPQAQSLLPAAFDPDLKRRALAYAHWGPLTIRKRAYRLP
jgi:phosphoglycerol transferase MdoB-like AlkP superfamily enzyme